MVDKPPRQDPGDVDAVLDYYSQRARVVVLWRQNLHRDGRWTYLARLSPTELFMEYGFMEYVQHRFGGGWYRAKIYGTWDRHLRQEEYLTQVTFGVDGPPTAETFDRIRRA